MTLPVSVCICTYNEEENIVGCLEAILANDPAQVIVVDGGSSDDTVKLARFRLFEARRNSSVRVRVTTQARGLASQRQRALYLTDQPYHMVVDAHHRLHTFCLLKLLDSMKLHYWDAVQARESQAPTQSYWTKARASANWDITYSVFAKKTNMVGRPALYRSKSLRAVGGFDSYFDGVGDEDTDLSIRMQEAGFKQAIGYGVARRVDELTFCSMLKKFVKYGRGDARIVKKYPHKKWEMVRHLLWVYPFKRGFKRLWYWPYYALCGWVRFGAMVWEVVVRERI